jgi:microcystin-dependent protein
MDGYIGEIRAFCFNYVPVGWALCDGSQMPISQNQALFSLIGDTYGPTDGRTYFTLPNLLGMTPLGAGTTVGGGIPVNVQPGQNFGNTSVTLSLSQIPSHTHQVNGAIAVSASNMSQTPATDSLLSRAMSGNTAYLSFSNQNAPDATMSPTMIQLSGGGAPHDNMQPFLTLNYCICLEGEYPVSG